MVSSGLSNARYSINTGGQLKFINQFDVVSDFNGLTIDLSEIEFEGRTGFSNSVEFINHGARPCYVLFDNDTGHSSINIDNRNTYNLRISGGEPYNNILLNGHTSKISLKCDSDSQTTMTILVW